MIYKPPKWSEIITVTPVAKNNICRSMAIWLEVLGPGLEALDPYQRHHVLRLTMEVMLDTYLGALQSIADSAQRSAQETLMMSTAVRLVVTE